LPGSADFAYAEGCRCCPDQLILRTPKAVGMARINCRSALAREWGFAATHLLSGSPRSPASRLLQIRVRGTLPVLPGSTDFAYAKGCRCCPDQRILRTPKAAGIAGSTVGARLPAKAILPQRICRLAHRVRQQAGSYRFAYAEGCRCCPDQPISRTGKIAGVARINGFRVRRRLLVLPGSTDFAYAVGCRDCPDQL